MANIGVVNVVAIWTSEIEIRRVKRSAMAFDRWLATRFLHIDEADVPRYLAEHETADIVAQMLVARQYG